MKLKEIDNKYINLTAIDAIYTVKIARISAIYTTYCK